MKFTILLLALVAYTQSALLTCDRKEFQKVGCFQRNKGVLPDLIISGREANKHYTAESGLISWSDYTNYLHSLACECATKAKSQGYKFFGIGFYGECFAGKNTLDFDEVYRKSSALQSNECVRGDYAGCGEGNHECAGKGNAEYIYQFPEQARDDTKKPVNGGYGSWSDWTPCDETCGEGTQARERSCNNPVPQHNGNDCEELGESTETRVCSIKECPVDGRFTRWSEYGECSATCNGGVQKRTRSCTNPEPSNGGKACQGLTEETQPCGMDPCPINGGFTKWSSYSKCSATCGGGLQSRERTCTNPKPQNGGEECNGPTEESRKCNENDCPVDGRWSDWSSYGKCSRQCGDGVEKSTRTCTPPQNGGKECEGDSERTRKCNVKPCPVDGKWSSWSGYTSCTKTCDKGTKRRTRTCTNPSPKHNGATCPGKASETVNCNVGVRCPYYTAYHENQACEGQSMKMWCTDKRQVIKLSQYWYGRQNKSTCKRGISWFWSTSCKHSVHKVYQTCQNKNNCQVHANNKWMGKDPCWGTYKYFHVKFRCYG